MFTSDRSWSNAACTDPLLVFRYLGYIVMMDKKIAATIVHEDYIGMIIRGSGSGFGPCLTLRCRFSLIIDGSNPEGLCPIIRYLRFGQ